KATLMNGREGTPMVSFLKHGLSESDINDVVSYVRSFHNNIEDSKVAVDTELTTIVESPYSLEETINAINLAITGKNFRIIRIQNMDDGLVAVDKEDTKKVIIYFCNFEMVNRALLIDPRVGLFLPCRITVVERNGKVYVYAMNPERLSHLFNNAELDKLCETMSELYLSIIEEATL
ncbi:MAG: DUF302 domain-containing protein, partial [Gammaproteobacteria bacterium]|nr:DUF302 domain-containing protein [Gammaproteobacteria bacterium]